MWKNSRGKCKSVCNNSLKITKVFQENAVIHDSKLWLKIGVEKCLVSMLL